MKKPKNSADTPQKKKGGCLKTVFIVVAVIIAIAIVSSLFGNDSSQKNPSEKESSTNQSDPAENIEPNTSAAVDAIAKEAKKSANHSASEEKRDTALQYIAEHYPDYYSSNEIMEKAMYYGYYLEYAYAKNGSDNLYANLGIDTYQAVKYVYRNTEDVSATHTQENLQQIKEMLLQLGYSINE